GTIEHQAHGEGGVVVLAGAYGMFEFGEPRGDPRGDGLLERAQRGVPLAGVGVVPFGELGGELQEPGESVWTLESVAAFAGEISDFLSDIRGSEALGHGPAGI